MENSINFDFQLLNLGYNRVFSNWNFGPICSSFTRIYYVTEGEGVVTIDKTVYRLTAGHLYIIPALTSHYDHCESVFSHFYIHCIDQSKKILKYYEHYKFPFEINAIQDDIRICNRLNQLCPNMWLKDIKPETYDTSSSLINSIRRFQSMPLGTRIEANGLILQIISRFFEKAKHIVKKNMFSLCSAAVALACDMHKCNPIVLRFYVLRFYHLKSSTT